jgi:hypothetical protein
MAEYKKNNEEKFYIKKEDGLVIKVYESRVDKAIKKRKSRPAWKHTEEFKNYF